MYCAPYEEFQRLNESKISLRLRTVSLRRRGSSSPALPIKIPVKPRKGTFSFRRLHAFTKWVRGWTQRISLQGGEDKNPNRSWNSSTKAQKTITLLTQLPRLIPIFLLLHTNHSVNLRRQYRCIYLKNLVNAYICAGSKSIFYSWRN